MSEKPDLLKDYQILCIPGGFSYGDDAGAGVVFASQIRHALTEAMLEFLQRDTLILGICNGFQMLVKAGILPGGSSSWPPTMESRSRLTLTWNENGRYTATWVRLKVARNDHAFLRGLDELELPIAHAEGRLLTAGAQVMSELSAQGQIALQYTDEQGQTNLDTTLPFPLNPNGAQGNIAGLSDPTGRILGLMPHPERFIKHTQHPRWTRHPERTTAQGLVLFQNAINYFAQ
jgi:phosphoribosylformylglycinamidine synthase